MELEKKSPTTITPPLIPSCDLSAKEIISNLCKKFDHKKQHHDSKKWMPFKVHTNQPMGINWFGDPHVDDDGCNWPLLRRDINICANTPGMFGANIGDTTNNWIGRLMKEYASQGTTRSEADVLIEWFLMDSGVDWLIWLLGNHDKWHFGEEKLKRMVKHVCTMADWRAQFKLVFPNGRECLIDAAHDHAGHSQWNSLHAQQKASTMGGTAHLYIAGHRHNWALAQNECPHTNRIYWLARARGYKQIDHYGENLGFGNQKSGASICSIIDPRASEINLVRCFADLEEGADYLKFLRKRA